MSSEKPRRLGRGLEALIAAAAQPTEVPAERGDVQRIPIARVRANPLQPRREFDPTELAQLSESLRQNGLLQPITVRPAGEDFQLVAGERRLRAAQAIGWTEIPAQVKDLDDRALLVLALVENLQRANLNAIEEAQGYRRLMEEFGLTQQQVAEAVGKDRTTVTNLLRVLTLPEGVQKMVESGALSAGHARALLALTDRSAADRLAREAATGGWSVRELERRVRVAPEPANKKPVTRSPGVVTASTIAASRHIEDKLRRYLQTDVKLELTTEKKGLVQIAFYSPEDLERLLDLIIRDRRTD
jgi:ParB family transcriptional regulator, chromosome partitioning protein